ncbi:DNA alkylation repair protein [Bifidobacterium cuniculi]|uniref:Putative DNA alkylation repair enzyme n=1 Tax=Bifidobacterium cuniculi TaxID=1688 RepID=A0A087AL31_9BIFI|nr:DNA alkylation repair protein [Bifidobacterium cuniculi]KFI59481.1 putative DNA alkylation repair enzyme [Bifidobacterium cuniculi]
MSTGTLALRRRLESMADPAYRQFNARSVPTVDPDSMIGIRVPGLRALAKDLLRSDATTVDEFLDDLPHRWFEENMLHAILIGEVARDEQEAFALLDAFLPHADNWAVTDIIRVKAFRRRGADDEAILERLARWSASRSPYTVRYAVVELMADFLDERFEPAHLDMVVRIASDDYYVNMARAWYLATALARQWNATLPVLEGRRLDAWTHNRTIRKACESFRVSDGHKAVLRALKVPWPPSSTTIRSTATT